MLGNRNLKQMAKAVIGKQHYFALLNMYRNYPAFLHNLRRYLTGVGNYPYDIEVKTPTGMIRPTLYSHDDLLTVNEIFCRWDYYADNHISTVVDVGSNIGISALSLTLILIDPPVLIETDPSIFLVKAKPQA